MFFNTPIRADGLPEKTLSLTFDDGPGPNSLEIGNVLFKNGIQGTFFITGKHANKKENLDTLMHLRDMGHLIANHGYDHNQIAEDAEKGISPVNQLTKTEHIIKPFTKHNWSYFRAPWGEWRSPGSLKSKSAEFLNNSFGLDHCIGPIHWDVSASDWKYWSKNIALSSCVNAHQEIIEKKKKGIVLLHDHSATSPNANNRQAEHMAILIPKLFENGYRFIRLDAIPQIESAHKVTSLVQLQNTKTNQLFTIQDGEARLKDFTNSDIGQEIGLVELTPNRVALRASNGFFISFSVEKGPNVGAFGKEINANTIFEIEMISDDRFMLRSCVNGSYLAQSEANKITLSSTKTTEKNLFFNLLPI